MKVVLVASGGGHLTQLWWLQPWWSQHERLWVTFPTPDATQRLKDERVVFAHHPTNRNVWNMARNTLVACRVLWRERPDWVVSTGAGVAVPFFWIARLFGAKTAFIEVFDRVDTPSRTGRWVSRHATVFVVQRPQQLALYPHPVCLGPVR